MTAVQARGETSSPQNKCGSGYTTMPSGTGTVPYILQIIQQGRNFKNGLT
jgi:hypothetical protein